MKLRRADTIKFQERLKELRTEKFRSMDAFCDRYNDVYDLNLSKATVSRWESGKQEPMLTSIVTLAEFFCVSIPWLMGYSNDRTEPIDEPRDTLNEIYKNLSVRDRAKLLAYACELEDSEK